LLVLLLSSECLAWGKKKQAVEIVEVQPPDTGYLINLVSDAVATPILATPKYRFYLYMSLGFVPKQEDFVFIVSTLCNLLYVLTLLAGFFLLPRTNMLVITLVTFAVGPALVLVLLGAVGVFLALSMTYPMLMALGLWSFFFLSSQVFQSVGTYLGLDQDADGDVDWLDILAWLASKPLGKTLGLDAIHQRLNARRHATLEHMIERVDELEQRLGAKVDILLGSSIAQ